MTPSIETLSALWTAHATQVGFDEPLLRKVWEAGHAAAMQGATKVFVVWDKKRKRIARGCGGRRPRIVRALRADAQNSMLFCDKKQYEVRPARLIVGEVK